MDYSKLCSDILNLDSNIRFAGISDESGETRYGGQREGIPNLLSPEETKRSNLQAFARWGLRNALASRVGKGKYAIAEYEKVKRMTIPLGEDHLLLITTEIAAEHGNIIESIFKLIQFPSDNYLSDG